MVQLVLLYSLSFHFAGCVAGRTARVQGEYGKQIKVAFPLKLTV